MSIKPQHLNVLLVEDDKQQRELISSILSNAGYNIQQADSCEAAIVLLKTHKFDLILSDWKLPSLSGLDLLNYVRSNMPLSGFVMATAHGSISHAVEAMQAGADDYLTKPFQRQEMLLALEKAERAYSLRKKNNALSNALTTQHQLMEFVGVSDAMRQVQDRISRVANTDVTVLITGESGTGKELAARALHNLSSRKNNRFVPINCGAIPSELAEAELFGAKKGAFTGANADKIGKFAFADKGTLFLDEIGELPLSLQAKLLRFLQEGSVLPLGDNKEYKVDVRVLAATHRDLSAMVASGEFREDLYYRLNIVPVEIPPLRERTEDIPLLFDFLLNKAAQQYALSVPEISKNTKQKLKSYSWPGNVRELSNKVERFVLLQDEVELCNFAETSAPQTSPQDLKLPAEGVNFEALESSFLLQALEHTKGNKAQAAKLLGMTYKAFLYRLDKHQIGKDID
ncbi:sigma-54-dependent transcriptional regulator [Glaciecola sp. 1036]|uniref:sigma-54-dependent transcriptional regulator n=1 Tax=Alteromonadaceae TaxID=72275 RepID=UPI003D07C235